MNKTDEEIIKELQNVNADLQKLNEKLCTNLEKANRDFVTVAILLVLITLIYGVSIPIFL